MSEEATTETKAKKTPDELKAEAEKKNQERIQRVEEVLQIGSSIKPNQREMFFKPFANQKNFQLTFAEWEEIRASQKYKPEYIDEVINTHKLVRNAPARSYVKSEVRPLVGGFRNVMKAGTNDTGEITNQALIDAGTKIKQSLEKIETELSSEFKLLADSNLEIMYYCRAIKDEEPDSETEN